MRLLLVEDSRRLTELIVESVHGAGWRIDGVGTLAEAFVALQCEEHDLLVLDLGLPDGNGVDLLRQLRKNGSTIPVLIVTAAGDVDPRISGLDAGADDYLVKPFHHHEFLARCRALARRRGGAYSGRGKLALRSGDGTAYMRRQAHRRSAARAAACRTPDARR